MLHFNEFFFLQVLPNEDNMDNDEAKENSVNGEETETNQETVFELLKV